MLIAQNVYHWQERTQESTYLWININMLCVYVGPERGNGHAAGHEGGELQLLLAPPSALLPLHLVFQSILCACNALPISRKGNNPPPHMKIDFFSYTTFKFRYIFFKGIFLRLFLAKIFGLLNPFNICRKFLYLDFQSFSRRKSWLFCCFLCYSK